MSAERTGTPQISVIVPAWNAERYLAQALDSVLAEGDAVAEIIVVDDGSDDDSGQAIARAFPRTRVLAQPHRGIAAARNLGVAAARGPTLAFVDADDLWAPGRLAPQLAALAADPSALVFGHAEEFLSPDLDADEAATLRPKPGRHPGFLPGAMLVSRTTFDRIGGFDETLPIGELAAFMQRATELGVARVVVPELVLRRRLHRDNFTRSPHHRNAYALLAKRMLDMKRSKS